MISTRPRPWPYLAALFFAAPLWVLAVEGWIKPSEIAMASPSSYHRLYWWLLPPLLLVLTVFGGRWIYSFNQTRLENQRVAAEQAAIASQQTTEQARAAAATARQRETLEVLGMGLVVEKFRNAQVWEAIEKVQDRPFESILPKEAEVVSGPLVRKQRTAKRGSDVFEYAERYFVEKIPLPGFVIFPEPTTDNPKYLDSGAGTLMGRRGAFTLFITAEQIYANDPDKALGKIFDFFDAHPDVPAVYVYADDGFVTRKFFRGYSPDDINGDPGWKPGDPTEAKTAFVLVRRDRVDKLIRPFAVDEPYQTSRDKPTNRLKTFYFTEEDEFSKRTGQAGLTAEEWERIVPRFIEQSAKDSRFSALPFWERGSGGFKPSSWIPVPWTKWQVEEFDALPTLGYLHRPQYASYVDRDGKTLPAKGKAAAFATAWQGALGTLAQGDAPVRLLFDAGGVQQRAAGLLPMSRGGAGVAATESPRDWLGTPQAVDTSARLGDTGAASPFVQIALALIAGYRDGGVTATANLRRPDGASILMVSPPTEPIEHRKTHPGAGRDPFKVPLAP